MKRWLQISSNLFLELCPQALNPKSAQLRWRHETLLSRPVISTNVIQQWKLKLITSDFTTGFSIWQLFIHIYWHLKNQERTILKSVIQSQRFPGQILRSPHDKKNDFFNQQILNLCLQDLLCVTAAHFSFTSAGFTLITVSHIISVETATSLYCSLNSDTPADRQYMCISFPIYCMILILLAHSKQRDIMT